MPMEQSSSGCTSGIVQDAERDGGRKILFGKYSGDCPALCSVPGIKEYTVSIKVPQCKYELLKSRNKINKNLFIFFSPIRLYKLIEIINFNKEK